MSEYSIPVQFIDPSSAATYPDKIDAAIAKVLDHGQYIMGPEVEQLEQDLKDFTGAKHALTCANGTDALTLTMMAWGVGPGDAVFVRVSLMLPPPRRPLSSEQRRFLSMFQMTPSILTPSFAQQLVS